MHISRCKYLFFVSTVFSRCCSHIHSAVKFYPKSFCHVFLASEETGSNKYQIHVLHMLTSGNFTHIHTACFRIFLKFKFDKNSLTYMTFVICNKFFDCSLINPWIMTKNSNTFFLTIICFTDFRPFRPWIVIRTCIRCLRHHFKLKDGCGSQSNRCSDAVISCITAADNKHFFIFHIRNFSVCQI